MIDFEKLFYEKGPEKVTARLQLLISPACKSLEAKGSCHIAVEWDKSKFELMDDNGHEGCGYISRDM